MRDLRTITYKLADLGKTVIHIGKANENEATRVQIDAGVLFAEYPTAVPTLKVINPAGTVYSAEVTRDGDYVLWDIKDSDLTENGSGEFQLTFTENGVVVKSAISRTQICPSITGGGTAPDPVQDWLDHAEEVLEEVEGAFPEGGTTGQVLAKKSDADFDTEWVDHGAGGVSDYDDLENRPQIGGVTLTGDKSLSDLGAASASEVSAKYTKPSGGIPASDIADGVIPDPTSIIDDTAGDGDTNKVWSADKVNELKSAITQVSDEIFYTKTEHIESENLYDEASEELTLTINDTSLATSANIHGFYVPVTDLRGKYICAKRTNSGKYFRGAFTTNVPANGVTYPNGYASYGSDEEKGCFVYKVPNDANYLYIGFYNSNSDTLSKADCLAGMTIYGVADSVENLFDDASEDMTLTCSASNRAGTYGSGTRNIGFYVPVDPSLADVLYISRTNVGQIISVCFSTNVPTVGGSFSNYARASAVSNWVASKIPNDAHYAYVRYHDTQADTQTKEQLLAGMTILQAVRASQEIETTGNKIEDFDTELFDSYGVDGKESIIKKITHPSGITFKNGTMTDDGQIVLSTTNLISDEIYVDGRFGIICPSTYNVRVCLLPRYGDGEIEFTSFFSNAVEYKEHNGRIRIEIKKANGTNLSPSDLDFSQLKFTTNKMSAEAFAKGESFVLDAETSKTADVYAYIDSAVKTHGNYATRTLLCNEPSGLPVYYYTLGSGAKKILIVSGQHTPPRDPKDGVITTAKLMHDLITCNFTTGSLLQKLHDECTLLVIPLMNPYGYDNNVGEDADGVNLNADWVSKSTTVVSDAADLISTFDPDIGIDIHTNGSTPLTWQNVGVQINLDSNNTGASNAMGSLIQGYYNMALDVRDTTGEQTLRYYITHTLGKPGGLIECKWFHTPSEILHNAQIETANYATVVNVIKYLLSVVESETFAFEMIPPQNQY